MLYLLFLLCNTTKYSKNIQKNYLSNWKTPVSTSWKVDQICSNYSVNSNDTVLFGPITDYELYQFHSIAVVVNDTIDSVKCIFKSSYTTALDSTYVLNKLKEFNTYTFKNGYTLISLDELGMPFSLVLYIEAVVYSNNKKGTISIYHGMSSESK